VKEVAKQQVEKVYPGTVMAGCEKDGIKRLTHHRGGGKYNPTILME
jgi:hypothetical protein